MQSVVAVTRWDRRSCSRWVTKAYVRPESGSCEYHVLIVRPPNCTMLYAQDLGYNLELSALRSSVPYHDAYEDTYPGAGVEYLV